MAGFKYTLSFFNQLFFIQLIWKIFVSLNFCPFFNLIILFNFLFSIDFEFPKKPTISCSLILVKKNKVTDIGIKLGTNTC